MKNEIQMQLYQAIKSDNVDEVIKLTKGIPPQELATFIVTARPLFEKIFSKIVKKHLTRFLHVDFHFS